MRSNVINHKPQPGVRRTGISLFPLHCFFDPRYEAWPEYERKKQIYQRGFEKVLVGEWRHDGAKDCGEY